MLCERGLRPLQRERQIAGSRSASTWVLVHVISQDEYPHVLLSALDFLGPCLALPFLALVPHHYSNQSFHLDWPCLLLCESEKETPFPGQSVTPVRVRTTNSPLIPSSLHNSRHFPDAFPLSLSTVRILPYCWLLHTIGIAYSTLKDPISSLSQSRSLLYVGHQLPRPWYHSRILLARFHSTLI